MKEDLRVIKTKNNLYESLLNVLKEKSFDKIKVSDICKTAKINRSTFYSHYNDKYELIEDYINSLKNILEEELSKNNYNFYESPKLYYMEMIRILFDHLEDRRHVYQYVIINNENSIMTNMIIETLSNDISKRLKQKKENINGVPVEIFSKFYFGAVINILTSWLKGNIKNNKEELLNYFDKLIPSIN